MVGPKLGSNCAHARSFPTRPAREAFQWPYCLPEDLHAIDEAPDEHAFPSLHALHDLMLSAKPVRRRKGLPHILKSGKEHSAVR